MNASARIAADQQRLLCDFRGFLAEALRVEALMLEGRFDEAKAMVAALAAHAAALAIRSGGEVEGGVLRKKE